MTSFVIRLIFEIIIVGMTSYDHGVTFGGGLGLVVMLLEVAIAKLDKLLLATGKNIEIDNFDFNWGDEGGI